VTGISRPLTPSAHIILAAAAFFLWMPARAAGDESRPQEVERRIEYGTVDRFSINYAAYDVSVVGTVRECSASTTERLFSSDGRPSTQNVEISVGLVREEDRPIKAVIAFNHDALRSQATTVSVPFSVIFGNVTVPGDAKARQGSVMIAMPSDAIWLLGASSSISLVDKGISKALYFDMRNGTQVGALIRRCAAERLTLPSD
jgi:hypothetical protein